MSRLSVFFIQALLFLLLSCAQTPFKSTQQSSYSGPLIDAVTQWDADAGKLSDIIQTLRASGVFKAAIGLRSFRTSGFSEKMLAELLAPHKLFIILTSPKLFPGKISKNSVDLLIQAISQYNYPYVSEAMFRHADKRFGKIHAAGEIYIDPLGANTRYLLDRLKNKNTPLFIHWEFYRWNEDYPKFSKLFSHYPKQKFILSHMGFGSPEQMQLLFNKHPNIFATISKRNTRFEYFLNNATEQGPSLLDEQNLLREIWRKIFYTYSDRLIFATDAHKDYMWNNYINIIAQSRQLLGQLPIEIAERVAYKNAERIFGL